MAPIPFSLPRFFNRTATAHAEFPSAEAPALDILSRLQSSEALTVREAPGPLSIGFSAENDGLFGDLGAQAKALRKKSREVFGQELSLGAFERMVDAPPHSRIVVNPTGEKITADVYADADPSQVLERLTFEKQPQGGVLVVHEVSRASAHASLAPIFGNDTTHSARIFNRNVTEQWRPSKALDGTSYYAETLPNGTRLQTTSRDAFNSNVMRIFKDPETRGPLAAPLSAEQLNELFFLPDGATATLRNTGSEQVNVSVEHPSFAADSRDYRVQPDGKVVFHQGIARVDQDHGQATGLGKDTFMQALGASYKYGVDAIEATAAGNGNGTDHVRDGSFVGYYVWPRFGFNGQIRAEKRAAMPPELSSARDMLELFALPGGAPWWKQNGHSLPVEFLLDPEGPNVAAFQRYVAEKQAAPATRSRTG